MTIESRASLISGYSFDLSGRTVLITGASAGIGKRFALIVAASGANVVLAARRVALLEQLKLEAEAFGVKALAVGMDVADEASTKAAYDAAEGAFGTVDSVVVNAGLNMAGSALGISAADFDQTVAVNLRGAFLTAREGARRMIAAGSVERGHGRIVLISSVTAYHTSPGMVPYAATKAGVAQMGKSMALDWSAKGINVNVLCPGYMRTDMTEELWEIERGKKLLASFPRQRLMDMEALDPLLLYLCSDASAQITGSVFTVDDGQTL
jgi:NAD(P)-dependent dehydrogenase (short-subunit alcohol dehydrogenase family)